jgi:hypothetical protein
LFFFSFPQGRPYLTAAFCCCTLKIGGIVMGVTSIGMSLIMLVGITLYTIENSSENYQTDPSGLKTALTNLNIANKFKLAAQVFHVSTIFWLSTATIISSVFLIWGTMTKRTRMMYPWLVAFGLVIAYVLYILWSIQVEYFTQFGTILGGFAIYSLELAAVGELE